MICFQHYSLFTIDIRLHSTIFHDSSISTIQTTSWVDKHSHNAPKHSNSIARLFLPLTRAGSALVDSIPFNLMLRFILS